MARKAESVVKPKKKQFEISLSSTQEETIKALAELQNVAFAEMAGRALEIGLHELVEEANRLNWLRESTAPAELLELVKKTPKDKLPDVIEYVRKLNEGGSSS